MKKETAEMLVKLADTGKTVAVGEYRLTEAMTRPYLSKTSGKREEFSGVWHTVEIGSKAVYIQDRSDECSKADFDVTKYKSPFIKGEEVVIEVQSAGYVSGKGERTAGVLHSVSAGLAKTSAKL